MAKNATWSIAVRDLKNNAIKSQFDSGYLRVYDGAQPAGPDTALGAQVKLSELRYNATAFGSSSSGVLTANAITQDSDAAATGTAAWYRAFKSDGTTALHDGTVGTSNANMIIATVSIVQHAVVTCSSHTITDAAASSQ